MIFDAGHRDTGLRDMGQPFDKLRDLSRVSRLVSLVYCFCSYI